MKKILLTGCAGFIGSNVADKLLGLGYEVVGVDNFNDYYDPKIKEDNIKNALAQKAFNLYRADILDFKKLSEIFKNEQATIIIHLAARAGVRPSIANPKLYAEVNVTGTVNLLKLAVDYKVQKFIFGSSSSVYGNSKRLPFREDDLCEQMISPYGASKRSAEFFVESFHRSGLNCIILRFFTVYGPRSRPDMAPAIFTKKILDGVTIQQFGDGSTCRDYTYIDDIVDGVIRTTEQDLDFEVINLGNNTPVKLSSFIKTLEAITAKKAKIDTVEKKAGDMENTWADISKAKSLLGWEPKTKLHLGLKNYISWTKKNAKSITS